MSDKNKECLQELVCLFLKINCEPSDAQFHALAESIAVDKEELESIAYEMLAESEDVLDDAEEGYDEDEFEIHADAEDILDGDVSPDNMSLDNVALNDGDPTVEDQGYQEETTDDGPDMHDVGVGLTTTDSDDVLSDDGPMTPSI